MQLSLGALKQASHFPLPNLWFHSGMWFSFGRLRWLLDNFLLQISRPLCQKPFLPMSTRTHSTFEVACGHLEKQLYTWMSHLSLTLSPGISPCHSYSLSQQDSELLYSGSLLPISTRFLTIHCIAWNSHCSPGCPWIHGNPPALASRILRWSHHESPC